MKVLVTTLGFLLTASALTCDASEADPQADAFGKIYASTCLKHLSNLDKLRAKLKNAPELPPDKAAMFLNGEAGSAWPVPDKTGTFVVALPKDKNLCLVYARRANASNAKSIFLALVEKPVEPLTSIKVKDEKHKSNSGLNATVSYQWALPQASRKMLFTLTTDDGPSADIQALASAAIVK